MVSYGFLGLRALADGPIESVPLGGWVVGSPLQISKTALTIS